VIRSAVAINILPYGAKQVATIGWRSFPETWRHCDLGNTLTEHYPTLSRLHQLLNFRRFVSEPFRMLCCAVKDRRGLERLEATLHRSRGRLRQNRIDLFPAQRMKCAQCLERLIKNLQAVDAGNDNRRRRLRA